MGGRQDGWGEQGGGGQAGKGASCQPVANSMSANEEEVLWG